MADELGGGDRGAVTICMQALRTGQGRGSVLGLGSGGIRLRFQKLQRPGAWPWGVKEGHWEECPRTARLWGATLQAGSGPIVSKHLLLRSH